MNSEEFKKMKTPPAPARPKTKQPRLVVVYVQDIGTNILETHHLHYFGTGNVPDAFYDAVTDFVMMNQENLIEAYGKDVTWEDAFKEMGENDLHRYLFQSLCPLHDFDIIRPTAEELVIEEGEARV